MRTLRVLSRLLAYPNAELLAQANELNNIVVEDGFLNKKTAKNISSFIDYLSNTELMDAQETYVELFDRGRAHCLHLFEHVHGESRFRGQAMLDLSERYAEKGLHIGVGELPDYLP
ncbi:MAG: nitrate reductase molybdenum cofactor assembly chaperone, partial [Robiginitomaculum sp.]|nr:nitrate reductase molybdenum cofactor assembly chaperone [Robiginitomaculum sp.]